MGLIELVVYVAIALVLLIGIGGLIVWLNAKAGNPWVSVPQPLKIVFYCVLVLLCIIVLAGLAGYGPAAGVRVR